MMSIFDPTRGSYSLGRVLLRRNTLYVDCVVLYQCSLVRHSQPTVVLQPEQRWMRDHNPPRMLSSDLSARCEQRKRSATTRLPMNHLRQRQDHSHKSCRSLGIRSWLSQQSITVNLKHHIHRFFILFFNTYLRSSTDSAQRDHKSNRTSTILLSDDD